MLDIIKQILYTDAIEGAQFYVDGEHLVGNCETTVKLDAQ